MLLNPYVTVAEFRSHPTFLDTLNLRSGDTNLTDQDDELRNILLMSSAMADNYIEHGIATAGTSAGMLQVHSKTERVRCRIDRMGQVKYHPNHFPVVNVTALSYGYTPDQLQPVTLPSPVWIEEDRQVVIPLTPAAGLANLQFGTPVYSTEVYTQWTYLAGYVNTLLGGAVAQGATTLPVTDATGVVAGGVYRIWDPGNEEAVTVANTYTSGLNIPLVAGLQFAHGTTTPVGISALPYDIHLAVILYACALLMRPDTEAEDVFPSSKVDPNTNAGDKHDGSGFINQAQELLEPYRRTR